MSKKLNAKEFILIVDETQWLWENNFDSVLKWIDITFLKRGEKISLKY